MARKIINSLQKGKIKVVIVDFWRSRKEKGIDIEIYVNGKFIWKPSKIFSADKYDNDKNLATAAAYEYANEVLDGKVSLAKASWEK